MAKGWQQIMAALIAATVSVAGCEMVQSAPRERHEPARAATAAPHPASGGGATALQLGRVEARPGEKVAVNATLQTGGRDIAGTQNDIEFDPRQVGIAARPDGTPDCMPNRRIGKDATAFSFLPQGCHAAAGQCTSVRALVLSVTNVKPIPNDSVLYTCNVAVAPGTAPGGSRLHVSRVAFSTPDGKAIDGTATDGVVTVR